MVYLSVENRAAYTARSLLNYSTSRKYRMHFISSTASSWYRSSSNLPFTSAFLISNGRYIAKISVFASMSPAFARNNNSSKLILFIPQSFAYFTDCIEVRILAALCCHPGHLTDLFKRALLKYVKIDQLPFFLIEHQQRFHKFFIREFVPLRELTSSLFEQNLFPLLVLPHFFKCDPFFNLRNFLHQEGVLLRPDLFVQVTAPAPFDKFQ